MDIIVQAIIDELQQHAHKDYSTEYNGIVVVPLSDIRTTLCKLFNVDEQNIYLGEIVDGENNK